MPYMSTALALIGAAFVLSFIALFYIVHAYYPATGMPQQQTPPSIPEHYLDLLESKRVQSLLNRARYDIFFRHRLTHKRETVLSKWRLSRKERTLLAEMSDRDMEELLSAFG